MTQVRQMAISAIGYVRVSTEEQAKEGISIDAQSEKLRQYADLHEIDLVDIIVDAGASAKSLKRPGLDNALKMLQAGEANALLIYKLDRLTRSVVDLGRLIDEYFEQSELLSVMDDINTSTANGRLVLNVLTSIAQWERETICERTADSLQYMKEQRRVYNHLPLGYRDSNGTLQPIDDEQITVAEIFSMHGSGISMHKIANELNGRGIVGKRGGAFYASTVRAILNNPIHQSA